MQAIVDIKFDELLKIVKSLPENKLSILKAALEKERELSPAKNRANFKALLLSGPTFSEERLADIAQTREAINKWRTN
ncbi:MAG TPA: hypothetical protein VIM55_03930 [Mucilaginibacter sp.]